jgi:hypothetical protein
LETHEVVTHLLLDIRHTVAGLFRRDILRGHWEVLEHLLVNGGVIEETKSFQQALAWLGRHLFCETTETLDVGTTSDLGMEWVLGRVEDLDDVRGDEMLGARNCETR